MADEGDLGHAQLQETDAASSHLVDPASTPSNQPPVPNTPSTTPQHPANFKTSMCPTQTFRTRTSWHCARVTSQSKRWPCASVRTYGSWLPKSWRRLPKQLSLLSELLFIYRLHFCYFIYWPFLRPAPMGVCILCNLLSVSMYEFKCKWKELKIFSCCSLKKLFRLISND